MALNKTMLVELVQHKDDWGGGDSHDQPNGKSWMDGLTPRGVDEILAEVKSAPVPGLSQESWSALSPQEQSALHSHLNGALILSERVEALARLAERLQEKVNELEAARPACVR